MNDKSTVQIEITLAIQAISKEVHGCVARRVKTYGIPVKLRIVPPDVRSENEPFRPDTSLFAANGKVMLFSRLCPEQKLLSDSSSTSYRTEVTLSLPEVKSPEEVRTKSSGTDSSSFPALIVKKVWVRADMAKNQCLNNFVTPCI